MSELIPSKEKGKVKELISFASFWSAPPENEEDGIMINDEWLDTENENMEHELSKTCNKCMSCISRLITEYNMHVLQYKKFTPTYLLCHIHRLAVKGHFQN